MPALDWNPSFGPVGMTIILFICGLVAFFLVHFTKRNLAQKHNLVLFIPKLILILLLLLALLDPTLRFSNSNDTPTKIVILQDISASMDLRDDGVATRSERVARLIQQLKSSAPAHFQFQVLPFDTSIHPADYAPKPSDDRGTDLASVITSSTDQPLVADANGEVIITDGGDETIELHKLPAKPIAIIGVGADADSWCDIGVGAISAPGTVEENSQFDLQAELYARQGTLKTQAAALSQLKVNLEQFQNGHFVAIQNQTVDLTQLHSAANFHVKMSGTGDQRYRISLPTLPGEITTMNNSREVTIQVEKRALHVLYFTQELGVDYKYLRNELGTDPGIALTAMYRVVENQFTVQGDRTGFQDLLAGFPSKLEILRRYDCVILGSFSASQLTDVQQQTLLQFIQEGGAVIFLGGDLSFGLGGYDASKLAPLFPWQLRKDEAPISQGTFPVAIAPTAGSVSFTDGWNQDLAASGGATLESLNRPGGLRPGALALINATVDGESQPVVVFQRYGKGQVLGIASNTVWKWATAGESIHAFYGKFLRQSVRGLTQRQEGGSLLGVRWDHDHYRPGETAVVSVRLQDSNSTGQMNGSSVTLVGSLEGKSGSTSINLDSVPAQPGFYSASILFPKKGEYDFHLDAYRGTQLAESYLRHQKVEPSVPEGADPELKEAYLQDIATRTKGVYANEKNIAPISAFLRQQVVAQVSSTLLRLIDYRDIFFGLILATLLAEWTLRRRKNLI